MSNEDFVQMLIDAHEDQGFVPTLEQAKAMVCKSALFASNMPKSKDSDNYR